MIKFGDPQIGTEEMESVRSVFASKVFVHGKKIVEFERDFSALFSYKHSVSVANCTAGLHLAHYSLSRELKIDNRGVFEVLCPAMTHVATAHAIELAGLKPIFVDCKPDDGNIDVNKLESLITPLTVGIAAMHFNGVPCDIMRIMDIARRYSLYVVEDCAISLGAKVDGKPIGSFGDIGAFSFHPVKQITTGEGGMLVVNDNLIKDRLVLERAFGVDRSFNERKQAGIYDVPVLGFNYRMAEIPAAIGIVQLRGFVNNEAIRKRNFEFLKSLLESDDRLKIIGDSASAGRSYYCMIVKLINKDKTARDKISNDLQNLGIQTSVYYPHPVPRLIYYREKYGFNPEKFAGAASISDETIALSIGPHLTKDDMVCISTSLKGLL